MKAFYIILLALGLTVGSVFVGRAQVKDFAESASAELREIEFSAGPEFSESVASFADSLKLELSKIDYAIMHQRTDTIKDHVDTLVIKAKNSDKGGFEETRVLLLNLLQKLSDAEKFSFSGVV